MVPKICPTRTSKNLSNSNYYNKGTVLVNNSSYPSKLIGRSSLDNKLINRCRKDKYLRFLMSINNSNKEITMEMETKAGITKTNRRDITIVMENTKICLL